MGDRCAGADPLDDGLGRRRVAGEGDRHERPRRVGAGQHLDLLDAVEGARRLEELLHALVARVAGDRRAARLDRRDDDVVDTELALATSRDLRVGRPRRLHRAVRDVEGERELSDRTDDEQHEGRSESQEVGRGRGLAALHRFTIGRKRAALARA
ncbi:MAG: hypothetical protein R3F34_03970 [Planctomycetota bacterium]